MIKYKLIISVGLICIAACSAKKKVLYEFPESMSDAVKSEYITQFNKGKILYELNCAKCHTTKKRGKEIIPDFNPDQLANYELRFANSQHEENLTESKMTEDELVLVITFLRYKKKNKIKNPAKQSDTTKIK